MRNSLVKTCAQLWTVKKVLPDLGDLGAPLADDTADELGPT